MKSARSSKSHGKKTLIGFQGAIGKQTAYSLINREWAQRLEAHGFDVQVDCADAADVVIHHNFEERFAEITPPQQGKFVAVRTWDFGPYPPVWVDKINAECDQLWVHSEWVRRQASESGIDPARIRVIPLGIDTECYQPRGEPCALDTDARFKFLFVGAAVARKGIDILLNAYRQAFSAQDSVCLVIKDHTGNVLYPGLSHAEQIRAIQRDETAPEILYLDTFLEKRDLAGLYRACDVSVFPYRAEGFAIPILEAIACGTPPLVPDFGACLDYCRPEFAFMIPAQRISLPVNDRFTFNGLGFEETLTGVDFCELAPASLAATMQKVVREDISEMRRLGVLSARRHDWAASTAAVLACLAELAEPTAPVRFRSAPG